MFRVFRLGTRGGKSLEPSGQFGSTVGRREFSYSELIKITDGFKNNIYKGAFGTCFHGYVDDLQVLVKMLYLSENKSQFQSEVEVLQRIHHRNLINIVGYCKEDQHPALILGYMNNGDLGKHPSENSSSVITWEARLCIAVQVAQGLEYLHDFCEPPIVHRNVKMGTILLSSNFAAKLGGFSLARPMRSDDSSHESTTTVGTPGYLDPESLLKFLVMNGRFLSLPSLSVHECSLRLGGYYCSNRLTVKSDVFSFGVVLLVIITARPVISRDQEYRHIIQWVNSMLEQGEVSEVIDPRMNGEYEIEFVEKAVKLAMACVSDTSNSRPSMNEVVSRLKECLAAELGSSTRSTRPGPGSDFNCS